ncbi:hypothetical protein [Saccharopolyspora mangrovi]|uniref:hypothetical protein n=1 Tax=Saccharopolyspora mangrovi TaxID=3082379 RepID=UPI002B4BE3E9|nr:hypothetical protein [Saccharopolyspora sp. S2-29]
MEPRSAQPLLVGGGGDQADAGRPLAQPRADVGRLRVDAAERGNAEVVHRSTCHNARIAKAVVR